MRVKIKGNKRKSRYKRGEDYYIIVRLDITHTEVFAYVNESKVNEYKRIGELREVVPGWNNKIPWKYRDESGKTKIYNANHNDWEKWNEGRKKDKKEFEFYSDFDDF